jgi:hypothetical protein
MFYRCALKAPSSQINLYCLSAEISKQQRYRCIYIYSFIPMSSCVGMGPSALPFPGARDAVKAALLLLLLSKKY